MANSWSWARASSPPGDLAGVVAWAAHDSAQYPQAVKYLTLAVHAARERGDRNLTAHLLQCLAVVRSYVGHPQLARDCIALALALYGTRNTASPVLCAGLHALDARFAAPLGQPRDALRAVHLAQEIFTENNPDPPRPSSPTSTKPNSPPPSAKSCSSSPGNRHRTARAARHRPRSRPAVHPASSKPAHTTAEQAAVIGTGLDSARVRRRYRDLTREPGQEGRRLTEVAADVSDGLRGMN